MESSPFVSVCVPMYNNAATISRCLQSVFSQQGVEFEVVVIDDDSEDESREIAAEFLRDQDRLVRNVRRLGLNLNHSRCLDLANGECVQIVHGDDALLPGALETLARCFKNPNVGLAFAPRKVITDDAEWELQNGRPHLRFRTLHELNRGSSLVKQMVRRGVKDNWVGELTSVMFRRDTALRAGGFRPDIYNFMDFDAWIRLMLRSDVCFVPREQSIRYHSSSTASALNWAAERYFLDRLRVLTWLIVDPAAPMETRILGSAWWWAVWLRLGVRTALRGPDRRRRAGLLVMAPIRELFTARAFLRQLGELSAA